MTGKAKPRGRPTKKAVAGERNPLSLRVTADAKQKLEKAARAGGRSLSQEAEDRINRSFAEEGIIEGMFASREDLIWAILQAREFNKAGSAASGHAPDAEWRKDNDCLLEASMAVVDALLRDLERMPGADLEKICDRLELSKLRVISRSESGFIKRDNDNEG